MQHIIFACNISYLHATFFIFACNIFHICMQHFIFACKNFQIFMQLPFSSGLCFCDSTDNASVKYKTNLQLVFFFYKNALSHNSASAQFKFLMHVFQKPYFAFISFQLNLYIKVSSNQVRTRLFYRNHCYFIKNHDHQLARIPASIFCPFLKTIIHT